MDSPMANINQDPPSCVPPSSETASFSVLCSSRCMIAGIAFFTLASRKASVLDEAGVESDAAVSAIEHSPMNRAARICKSDVVVAKEEPEKQTLSLYVNQRILRGQHQNVV